MTRALAFTWLTACWLAPACANSFAAQGHHRRAVEIAAAKSPVPHDDHVDPPSTTSVGPGAAVPTLSPISGARKPAATHTSASHAAAQRDRASLVGAFPALVAAQMAWLEGGWSLADAAAIVHAIKRRVRGDTGEAFVAMANAYSQLDAQHERAAFARALPWGDEPTWPAAWNEKWARVRTIARGALEGRIGTPCPGARGWGGSMDKPKPGQRPFACRRRTANWFYRVEPTTFAGRR